MVVIPVTIALPPGQTIQGQVVAAAGNGIPAAADSSRSRDLTLAFDVALVRPAEFLGQARIVHVEILFRVIEDVVAGVAALASEHRLEARPPQLARILPLVDHHRVELVLRSERVVGLDQRLGGLDVPEILVVPLSPLPQGHAGLPAEPVDQAVVVQDH